MAATTIRTPKRGLVRWWILLRERNKLAIVALLSVVVYWLLRELTAPSVSNTYQVEHVIGPGVRLCDC
jgi:hypothetical protein